MGIRGGAPLRSFVTDTPAVLLTTTMSSSRYMISTRFFTVWAPIIRLFAMIVAVMPVCAQAFTWIGTKKNPVEVIYHWAVPKYHSSSSFLMHKLSLLFYNTPEVLSRPLPRFFLPVRHFFLSTAETSMILSTKARYALDGRAFCAYSVRH